MTTIRPPTTSAAAGVAIRRCPLGALASGSLPTERNTKPGAFRERYGSARTLNQGRPAVISVIAAMLLHADHAANEPAGCLGSDVEAQLDDVAAAHHVVLAHPTGSRR